MTEMVGVFRSIADIRSRKVRMYLRELEKLHEAKQEVARATDEAKKRRGTLTGGEWAQAQREAVQFGFGGDLV